MFPDRIRDKPRSFSPANAPLERRVIAVAIEVDAESSCNGGWEEFQGIVSAPVAVISAARSLPLADNRFRHEPAVERNTRETGPVRAGSTRSLFFSFANTRRSDDLVSEFINAIVRARLSIIALKPVVYIRHAVRATFILLLLSPASFMIPVTVSGL